MDNRQAFNLNRGNDSENGDVGVPWVWDQRNSHETAMSIERIT